jgi:hypothetical protein
MREEPQHADDERALQHSKAIRQYDF